MSDEETPNNQWLIDAINRAKQSALPILIRDFVEEDGADVESIVDAIELALLAISGEVSEEKLRNALRSVAEPYAQTIGVTWESMADAIMGTLEWVPPDPAKHVLDSWGGQ